MVVPRSLAELRELLTQAEALFVARPMLAAAVALGVLIHVLAWCRVLRKAGYPAALGLLAIVPPFALVFPFALGFLRSPADRELATLRGIDRLLRKRSETTPLRRAG